MPLLLINRPICRAALLLLLFVLAAGRADAQAPVWRWAVSTDGSGRSYGNNTVVDATGNVYVTGGFSGTVNFGATTLTAVGTNDVFVAKLTSTGTYQWAVQAGGDGYDNSVGLALDGNGTVVITGAFSGATATFGTTTLINTTQGTSDIFVAKLSASGTWQWATSARGSDEDNAYNLAVDGSGDVYLTGYFISPTLAFGSTTLLNAGNADAFVARISAAGIWQWATQISGSDTESATGMALDGSGNVYVCGRFTSPAVVLGATTLTNAGSTDAFVARLSPAGAWQWAVSAGGSGFDDAYTMAVDGSNHVVVIGSFDSQTATFGTNTLTNTSFNADVFVARLTPGGAWQWAVRGGGNGLDHGISVAVDGRNDVYIAGYSQSPVAVFGGTVLQANPGNDDGFVAKLTAAGDWQWATGVSGSDRDRSIGVAVDGSGDAYVTGNFSSPTLTLGTTTLTNANSGAGLQAMFIGRLSTVTGVADGTDALAVGLSPNPARDVVQLTGGPTRAPFTLLDALGRVVLTGATDAGGAATLDVRGQPAGLYVMRAGAVTRRLVVE